MHVDQNCTIDNNTFKILHNPTTFLVHSFAINHFPTWSLILKNNYISHTNYKLIAI